MPGFFFSHITKRVIGFNDVDIRMYQSENVLFTEAARPTRLSSLKLDNFLCPPKLKSITVLSYDFK